MMFVLFSLITLILGSELTNYFTDNSNMNGRATWHGPSVLTNGKCSLWGSQLPTFDNVRPVAINAAQYFGSLACGTCLEVTGTGEGSGSDPVTGTFIAYLTDECTGCAENSIDLNEDLDGNWGITWRAVPCPVTAGIRFQWVASTAWWMKIQVRNSRYPVETFSVKQGEDWVRLVRTPDNYFYTIGSGLVTPYQFPLTVKLCDIFGDCIEESLALNDNMQSEKQFPVKDGQTTEEAETTETPGTTETGTTEKGTTEKAETTVTAETTETVVETTENQNVVAAWGQCGGINYNGSSVCEAGTTCVFGNDWWSSCIPSRRRKM